LLERCLDSISNQTHSADAIIVINNASTDGTVQMLESKNIDYITQENQGAASGWYRAIEYSLENNFHAIWLMDDDGYPNKNALKNLEQKLTVKTASVSSSVVCENDRERLVFPLPRLNRLNLPVLFSYKRKFYTLSESQQEVVNELYPFAHFFNGSLISVDAIKKIGNIERDFFIFGEELDYLYRLRKVGEVLTDLSALHYHPDVTARPWTESKVYYYIKNTIILNKKYYDWSYVRSILTIIIALYRVMIRNGFKDVLSYIFGRRSKSFYLSIYRGFQGKLAKDFYAEY